MTSDSQQRREFEALDCQALRRRQLARLNGLLERILPDNEFYAGKLKNVSRPIESLEHLRSIPFTTKEELPPAGGEPWAANRTFAPERYVHFHQTSGTRGRPLVVLDTAEDWRGWIESWQFVLDAAELTPDDRALMAFSFGPFIGFWTAYDAVQQRGCLAVPSGGMSSRARLELLGASGATALFCTPSYALHLAETASTMNFDLPSLPVRVIVVAGELGGSIPATRSRIETAWQARLVDHSGATEVGAWGYADPAGRGLFVNERDFLPEFFSLESDQPAREGELAELVITSLHRPGSPVIRYRTGDLVRPCWEHEYARREASPNRFVLLEGGVLGRSDDMMIIRGVNVYPSAIEQIIRGFPDIAEFRLTAYKQGEMDQLKIEIEAADELAHRLAEELQGRLGLRVSVAAVPPESLPRFEAKGRRFVDER